MSNVTSAAFDAGDIETAMGAPLAVPAETDGGMRAWAQDLVDRARTEGVALTGEDGLLTSMVREVLQTGLDVEMADHLSATSPTSRSGVVRGTVATAPIPRR